MKTAPLLSISADAKTVKGEKYGYLTGILYLAPSNESKVINTCPFATKGCRAACLFTAGRGAFNNIRKSRIDKTLRFSSNKDAFMKDLALDIGKLIAKAKAKGMTPAVRLNGTSDIDWHAIPVSNKANVMELFPGVQFYDYTASAKKALDYVNGKLPANYHITFSYKETKRNHFEAGCIARQGGNVAVVFATPNFPKTFFGRPVVNGDESDLRFNDDKGVVVGLKAKGKARQDTTGFVVH